MLRRALEALIGGGSIFESYYSNLVNKATEGAPTVTEAKKDFRKIYDSAFWGW